MSGCFSRFCSPLQAQHGQNDPKVVVVIRRPKELQLVIVPGRESEPEVHKEASSDHCFLVAEGVEGELPVILAHPALANSAERESIS